MKMLSQPHGTVMEVVSVLTLSFFIQKAVCDFLLSAKVVFSLTGVGQKVGPRKRSVPGLWSQVLPQQGEWLVPCVASLPPVAGEGQRTRQAHKVQRRSSLSMGIEATESVYSLLPPVLSSLTIEGLFKST